MSAADHPVHHDRLVSPAVHRIIQRAWWQEARSVSHVPGGRHEYCVLGWDKDDLEPREFWALVEAIRRLGREEIWQSPPGFYDRGQRSFRGRYLYVTTPEGQPYAYWYSRSGPTHMANREHLSVQAEMPTRRLPGEPVDEPDGPRQLTFEIEGS